MSINLTLERAEQLRNMKAGTGKREIIYDEGDVFAMKRKLETLYTGRILLSFAEKMLLRYLAYEEECA